MILSQGYNLVESPSRRSHRVNLNALSDTEILTTYITCTHSQGGCYVTYRLSLPLRAPKSSKSPSSPRIAEVLQSITASICGLSVPTMAVSRATHQRRCDGGYP